MGNQETMGPHLDMSSPVFNTREVDGDWGNCHNEQDDPNQLPDG